MRRHYLPDCSKQGQQWRCSRRRGCKCKTNNAQHFTVHFIYRRTARYLHQDQYLDPGTRTPNLQCRICTDYKRHSCISTAKLNLSNRKRPSTRRRSTFRALKPTTSSPRSHTDTVGQYRTTDLLGSRLPRSIPVSHPTRLQNHPDTHLLDRL